MKVCILNQREVKDLLSLRECIGVMEQVFLDIAAGNIVLPIRTVMNIPGGSVLGLMPSYNGETASFGAKVVSVFPSNHGTEYDAHQGVVLLYEAEHGCLQAIVDATAITGVRTAAVSAAATRILANPDAGHLAILGAGVQAYAHLQAMRIVRDLKMISVWSIYPEETVRFAERARREIGVHVNPCDSAEAAVNGADLICTTTPAREPILRGDWIAPGAHINAIGACTAVNRELDTAAVKKAKLFVDSTASARAEAGDFVIPLREGAIGESHIRGELGEVLSGKKEGRSSGRDITLFKGVGLSLQDLAAARYVYGRAEKKKVGIWTEIGGLRD